MNHTYLEDIKRSIEESDLIVVGLGEEWNLSPKAQSSEAYQRVQTDIQAQPEYRWLWPYFYDKLADEELFRAYQKLFSMLEGRNYYVVATAMNRNFVPFVQKEKVVMPCGSEQFMCDDALTTSTDSAYGEFIASLEAYWNEAVAFEEIKFVRDADGQVVPFNNVYAPGYKEEGYLSKWSEYMSWLQGTMNRKTCLLELGAGLQFPSVFRFPFEKMVYFNRKALCYRVHKFLYQVTEEMAERSKSVPVHAVELFAGE